MRTERIRESRQKKKTRRPAYGRHAAAAVLAGLLAVSFVLAGCRDQSTVVERIAEETEGESLPEETADSMEAAASEQQADSEEKEQDFDPASADAIAAPVKEERVSVQADASGKPKKIEVSGTLSGFSAEDGAFVTDRSGLTELKNSRGEEEYHETEDGTVYWQNLGGNIRYEGLSDRPLPVGVRVTYYLDGEEMPLQDMKGKSGEIRIRFDYENKTEETVDAEETDKKITVPFLAVSLAVLPEDVFSDVKISNGKIIDVGGQRAAAGFALPGLEDELLSDEQEIMESTEIPSAVEITAHAENFGLDFTGTILTAGLLEDMDLSLADDLEEQITGLSGSLEQLSQLGQLSNLADQLEAAAAAEPESVQLQALTAWAEPLRRCAEIAALAESAREITRYEDLLQRIRCVQQADLEYGGYTPAQEGQKVSSVFLIETDGTE